MEPRSTANFCAVARETHASPCYDPTMGAGGALESARLLWERGKARWPELPVSLERFTAFVSSHESDAETPWDRLHAEDLYLACACVDGVVGAADAFVEELRADLAGYVARVTGRTDAKTEITDELLVDVLVGRGGSPPKLATYAGRGPLRAWLRMVAVRRSLNAARDDERHARGAKHLFHEMMDAGHDPELAFIKRQYGPAFDEAFHDAVAAIDPTHRALLRLHYGEGVTLAVLGAMHGWSKPTTSRRLADARDALLTRATGILREKVQLGDSSLESLLKMMRSNIEENLAALMSTRA
jgi:RNA polymerase sigma-70 factor (ECF subfamily)